MYKGRYVTLPSLLQDVPMNLVTKEGSPSVHCHSVVHALSLILAILSHAQSFVESLDIMTSQHSSKISTVLVITVLLQTPFGQRKMS